MSDTAELFTQLSQDFAARVQKVDPDAWGSATPCAEWDVRALVNHVVGELLWSPPLVAGQTIADVGDRFDGDVLGGDPAAVAESAAAGAAKAFSAPGALERTVHLSFGDFSGDDYCWQLISDLVVHSWDLARGVGSDDTMDAGTAERVHDFIAPILKQMAGSPYFAKPIDVSPDASAQERLLAATGRRP